MYEGLTFSHVKYYYDLSTGFKNLPRKPKNSSYKLPLTSIYLSLQLEFWEYSLYRVFH